MYAIYALAAKISFNNFLGLFVIESALLFAGFYVLLKLAELAGFKKSKYTVAFFGLALFYGSNVFGFGGSPEELVFPLTAWFIYNVLRDFQHDQFPKATTMLINGILFSIVFWIKFSLIGYFVGYYVAYGLYLIFKRHFKNFFKLLSLSLVGFAIPSAIVVAVFAVGHALNALYKVYFVTNLTMYGNTISAAGKFFTIFKSMGGDLISHPFTAAMIVIWLLILSTQFRKKAYVFYVFASMIGLQFLTVYLSGNTQWYYLLAAVTFVAALLPNSLGFLINNFNLKIGNVNFTRLDVLMIIIGFLLLNGGNTNLRTALFKGQQINPVASVKFGEYMREHYTGSRPTLIEYNGIDSGFFLQARTLPTTRYFEQTNFPYKTFPYSYDSQLNTIKHRKVQFVAIRSNDQRDFRNQLLIKKPQLFTQIVWYDISNARHTAYVPKVLMKNYRMVKTVYTSANGEQITALLFQVRKHPLNSLNSLEKKLAGD